MILIIGGAYEGKLAYGKTLLKEPANDACFYGAADSIEDCIKKPILYQFHQLVRRLMAAGESPELLVMRLFEEHPEVIIITNELGGGIVPLDPFDRAYREMTGTLCCQIAQGANQVHRVICGIGIRIK